MKLYSEAMYRLGAAYEKQNAANNTLLGALGANDQRQHADHMAARTAAEVETLKDIVALYYTALSRASNVSLVLTSDLKGADLTAAKKARESLVSYIKENPDFRDKKETIYPPENADHYGNGEVPFADEDNAPAANSEDPADQAKEIARDEATLDLLSSGLRQKELQNAADSIGILMRISSPIKIITAKQMYDMLMGRGQPGDKALANKIMKHGRGESGGASGVHLEHEDGTHYIYVSAREGIDKVRTQVGNLAHELGHVITDTGWRKLAQANPTLATEILNDFMTYLGSKTGRNQVRSEALRALLKDFNPGKTDPMRFFSQMQDKNPKEYKALRLAFREWLADNAGLWILKDKKPRSAVDSWFKARATELVRAFHELKAVIRRILSDNDMPVQLTSVSAWMNNLAMTDKQFEKEYGFGAVGQSIKDKIMQRRSRLQNWALTGKPDIGALNDMIPSIANNLEAYLTNADANLIRRVAFEPNMRRRMMHLVGSDTKLAEQLDANPNVAAATMYTLTTMGILAPSGKAYGLINAISDALGQKNRMTLEATEEEIDTIIGRMNNIEVVKKEGYIIPPTSPAARLYKERSERYASGVLGTAQRAGQMYKKTFSWLVDVPYERLIDTQIPELIALGKAFQPMAWELTGLKRAGAQERSAAQYQLFARRAGDIFKGVTEEEMPKLAALLQNANPKTVNASAKTLEDERKIRNLMERMYEYEAGHMDIKKRERYWPMVLNTTHIMENLDETVDLYLSTPMFRQEWERVRNDYLNWIHKNGEDGDGTEMEVAIAIVKDMTIEEFVSFYLTRSDAQLLPGNKIKALKDAKVHVPSFRFMNPRELNFLLNSGDDDLHKRIMSTLDSNIAHIMQNYIRSAAKRTEYERVMKNLGEGGIKGVWARAKAQGATDKDIRIAVKYIDAMNNMLGLTERDAIDHWIDTWGKDSWLQQFHSNKASIMNEKLQTANSFATMWLDISHLTLAVASASVDPFGQLVRHGSMDTFLKSLQETHATLHNLSKGLPISSLAEMVMLAGTLEHYYTQEDLAATYYGPGMTPFAQNVMNKFFKYNGVQWVTDKTRMMSSFAAFHAVADYYNKSQDSNPVVAEVGLRELHRLGLVPEDVKFDANGHVMLLNWDAYDDAVERGDDVEIERDLRVRTAIHRFVDECTVRPTSSTRPFIASNPYYQIVTLWGGFITAYDNQILRPAIAKAMEDHNYVPIVTLLASFVPIMLFVDTLRDAVKMALSDDRDEDGSKALRPTWKKDWTFADHLMYAVERAGIFGRHEKVMDIAKPLFQGDVPAAISSVGGVAVSDINKMAKWGLQAAPYPTRDLINSWDLSPSTPANDGGPSTAAMSMRRQIDALS